MWTKSLKCQFRFCSFSIDCYEHLRWKLKPEKFESDRDLNEKELSLHQRTELFMENSGAVRTNDGGDVWRKRRTVFVSTYGPAWISCAQFAYYRSLNLSLRTIQKKMFVWLCRTDIRGELSTTVWCFECFEACSSLDDSEKRESARHVKSKWWVRKRGDR